MSDEKPPFYDTKRTEEGEEHLPPRILPFQFGEHAKAVQAERAKAAVPQRDVRAILSGLIVDRKRRIPHLNELIESVLVEWGGPDEFARSFHDTYLRAKPGSVARARMLEKMFDLIKVNAQNYGAQEQLDDLSDEDLVAFIQGGLYGQEENSSGDQEGQRRAAAEAAGEEGDRGPYEAAAGAQAGPEDGADRGELAASGQDSARGPHAAEDA